jgi:hypothetical protein
MNYEKLGSVLVFNYYNSSSSTPATNNTRITIRNNHETDSIGVSLFFVKGSDGTVTPYKIPLITAKSTEFILLNSLLPDQEGYAIAVATDSDGWPVNFNYLTGMASVKLPTNHKGKTEAIAIRSLRDFTPEPPAVVTALNFDGVDYERIATTNLLTGLPSMYDGNNSILVLNSIFGNTTTRIDPFSDHMFQIFDDAEDLFVVSTTGNGVKSQLKNTISATYPPTTPPMPYVISAGRSGHMIISSSTGFLGSFLNYSTGGWSPAFTYNENLVPKNIPESGAGVLTIDVIPNP